MPWNDNANPGPWGSPPPNDGNGDKKPRRPQGGGPRGPRRPEGPDLNAAFEKLQRQLRDFFSGGPGGEGVRPAAVAAVAGVGFGLWALSGV